MSAIHALRLLAITGLFCTAALLPRASDATIVEFETVLGNFEVNLYDNATPQTVSNFLNYVENGIYSDSIFHRSVPGFIAQYLVSSFKAADSSQTKSHRSPLSLQTHL